MADTDASGVIYFTNAQMIAIEAFEDFLHKSGYCLDSLLREGPFLFPIVHSEADYLSAMRVGDELNIQMKISHIGTSSFTTKYTITALRTDLVVATISIIHVVMCKETKRTIPLSKDLLALFEKLM